MPNKTDVKQTTIKQPKLTRGKKKPLIIPQGITPAIC